MKAYRPIMVCIILAFALHILSLIFALFPVPIHADVHTTTQVNYNNYTSRNARMDVKDDRLAWQSRTLIGPKLTIVDDTGDRSVVHGVSAPFQLLEDQVVFIGDDSLKIKSLDGKTETYIADDVSSFIAMPNAILYRTGSDLYQYDPYSQQSKHLKDDTYLFFVRDAQIYSMETDGLLSRLEEDGSWTEVIQLHPTAYPFSVQLQGDCIVYEDHNVMCFVDMDTGRTKQVHLNGGTYSNHQIRYICDEDNTFVSFQGTKTNGSIITDIEHDCNGLWVIDAETLTLRKLSDDTFRELYLFDDGQLFGVKDLMLYQIDPDTGSATQVTDYDLQDSILRFLVP